MENDGLGNHENSRDNDGMNSDELDIDELNHSCVDAKSHQFQSASINEKILEKHREGSSRP